MNARISLRARIVILVVVAIVPLFGMSIFKALHNADAAVERAKGDLQFAVSLAAAGQERVADSARQLLTAIASLPDLQDGKNFDCDRYFSNLIQRLPEYANMGILGLDGYTRCHALSNDKKAFSGDRAHFLNAIEQGRFVTGNYRLGPLSGKPIIAFAQPMIDADDKVTSVVFAAFDLGAMAKSVAGIQLPLGAALGIQDRNGILLAGKPTLPTKIGQKVLSPVLREAVATWSTGVREGPDGAGRDRLWAFMPSSLHAEASVFVSVSMDRDLIVGPVQRQLWLELAMLALMAFLGGGVAWMIGGRAIVAPTRQILYATRELEKGHLHVRIPVRQSDAQGEFSRISSSFNLMADSLEQRENDLEKELARSRQAYSTLELTINSMQEGLMAVDIAGRLLLINDMASRLFAIDGMSMVLAPKWPQQQGLFAPGTQTLYSFNQLPLYKALQGESGGALPILVRNEREPAGRLISCSYRPMLGPDGIVGALMVFADITQVEQMQMEQTRNYLQLREVQRKLLDAQRLGRIGNWELNLKTGGLWWSDEVYELYGLAREDFDGTHDSVTGLIHPEDLAEYERLRDAAMRDGLPLDVEYRIVTPNGQTRWIHQHGEVRTDRSGVAVLRAGVVQDITGRKLAEQAATRTTELLRRTGEMGKIGGWEVILDGLQPIWSEQIYRIHELDGAVQPSIAEALAFYAPEARPVMKAAARAAAEHGTPWDLELPVITAKGRRIWVRTQGRALMQDGKVLRIEGALQDITERKLSEQALMEGEQRYAALFKSAPLAMWIVDAQTRKFLAVNEAAVSIYGYTRDEFLKLSLFDIRSPAEQNRLKQHLAKGVTGVPSRWLHIRKDGLEFPVQTVARAISYLGREARFAVAIDITTQVKTEKDIQEYLFTLQRAADATQAITGHRTLEATLQETVDQARAVVGAHQAVVSLTARDDSPQAINVLSLSDKYANCPDFMSQPHDCGIYSIICDTNRPMRLTQAELEAHPLWRNFGDDASKKPSMRGWLAVPLTGRSGENIGLLQLTDKYEGDFTLQDQYVSVELAQLASIAIENAKLFEQVNQLNLGLEEKVAQRTAALTRQEAMSRVLAEQAPQVIWNADTEGKVTYANRKWYELMGGAPEDWLGDKWLTAVHPDDLADLSVKWKSSRETLTSYEGIRRLLTRDNTYHTMSYRASPVLDDRGRVLFWVGIDADVTEIKAVESALRLSNQELEAFSYSVSHDLRSPLNTVEGFSRLLAKQLDAGPVNEKIQHYLSRIQAGVAQMGRLIEDLLSLAQVSRMQLHHATVDLSALAREIADECQGRSPERVASIHIENGLQAQGDARLLRVMMENLVGNAWKFTSQQAHADIEVGHTINAAGLVVFFVRDNGAGFDMAYADKLFNTFQRLHAVTEFPGTGVGLATVSRVIGRHGGEVWAEAAPGKGATFFFALPGGAVVG